MWNISPIKGHFSFNFSDGMATTAPLLLSGILLIIIYYDTEMIIQRVLTLDCSNCKTLVPNQVLMWSIDMLTVENQVNEI